MNKSTGGLGIGMILFLIFLILKLTHVIAWSWWWVFAPIWIPLAFVVLCIILYVICDIVDKIDNYD